MSRHDVSGDRLATVAVLALGVASWIFLIRLEFRQTIATLIAIFLIFAVDRLLNLHGPNFIDRTLIGLDEEDQEDDEWD